MTLGIGTCQRAGRPELTYTVEVQSQRVIYMHCDVFAPLSTKNIKNKNNNRFGHFD